MTVGRKPNPKPVAPIDAWYNVLARALGVYNFPTNKPTTEAKPQTTWRHLL